MATKTATQVETMREEVARLVNDLSGDDLPVAARLLRGLLATDDGEPAMYSIEDAPEVEPDSDEVEMLADYERREAAGDVRWASLEDVKRRLLGEDA